ncbi:PASTA domain-containing protein [Micromonospora deserti]|uniref:Penicillin-binding protein n=1 Tax=Micromonospora deserti TaxID=2070366 RepID=A0A2W2DFK7_9ACTN|nr:PASTA domain-containing protein [Micromonospora deserti]PZF98637.1 penicillin-binding protein [Micromonospora deserti]
MTDADAGRKTRAQAGPGRLTLVLGGGLTLVLLAAVGATGGWLLAGEDGRPAAPAASASTTGSPTGAPTARPTQGRTTPAAPRTTATGTSGLTVPPVIGENFEDARYELRHLRLGWRLVFGGGTGTTVERTSPAVGTQVSRGTTVTLYVTGPAPVSTVPDVVGDDCDEAADELVEEGFYPRYRLRRTGTVVSQDPAGGSAGRWNDQISIWCGDASAAPGSADPAP